MTLPKNILIVEDEAITQRYLKDILAQYDISAIDCFDNAKDTMKQLESSTYDIVLMDINIKGSVDGLQLANKILDKYTLPIVFITAHSDSATLDEALELSPYGFITKPFSAKNIEVTLQIAYKRFLTHEQQRSSFDFINRSAEEIIIDKNFTYYLTNSTLYRNNELVTLSLKQTRLIKELCTSINHPISYEALMVSVWGDEEVSDSSLRTLVYSVRKLLPDLPLVSHSKVGYSIDVNYK